jgi:hypothetical protein
MDSREVLEKEISDGVGRACSCELRFPRRNSDANTPMRLPSELRRRVEEPGFEVAKVSVVSMGCSEPLRVGSGPCSIESTGISFASFSEMSSGRIEALDGPRVCTCAEALPFE